MVGLVFCTQVFAAQGLKSTPMLYDDKIQINAQAPASKFFPAKGSESDVDKVLFPVSRFFQTEFTIQNTGPSYKNHTVLWCYLPLNNGYDQVVPKVSASDEARIFTDSYGNLFLRFDMEDIPPYSTKILRVDCEVLKSKETHITSASDKDYKKRGQIYFFFFRNQEIRNEPTFSD